MQQKKQIFMDKLFVNGTVQYIPQINIVYFRWVVYIMLCQHSVTFFWELYSD